MNYPQCYWQDLKKVLPAILGLKQLSHAKILITGAGGLIGSAVADLLLCANDELHLENVVYLGARNPDKIAKRFGAMLDRPDVCYFPYDALKPIQSEVCFDYIIHGASPANPAAYVTQPVETMLANITGMENLLRSAHKWQTKRVLFVSSSEVYGRKESAEEPYREGEYGFVDILNPRACYPSAKRAAETLCAAFQKEYGVDSVIARPGHVYGPTATPEDNRASSQFFQDVISGRDIVMKSAGTQMRSYCYVADCASALLAILINGQSVTAYNVSNRRSIITIRQLAEMIAQCNGKQVVFENPSDVELSGYNMMDNSSLDSSALEQLGWESKFDAMEGIRHTFEIMSKQ